VVARGLGAEFGGISDLEQGRESADLRSRREGGSCAVDPGVRFEAFLGPRATHDEARFVAAAPQERAQHERARETRGAQKMVSRGRLDEFRGALRVGQALLRPRPRSALGPPAESPKGQHRHSEPCHHEAYPGRDQKLALVPRESVQPSEKTGRHVSDSRR
jgi:hypothetical protein